VAELGARVVGYKHHRSTLTPRAGQTPAWSWNGGAPEGFVWRRVHASYLTLHWAGTPEIARRLVMAAMPALVPSQPAAGAGRAGVAGVTGGVGEARESVVTALQGPTQANPTVGPPAGGSAGVRVEYLDDEGIR
jgi:hypothetical protein